MAYGVHLEQNIMQSAPGLPSVVMSLCLWLLCVSGLLIRLFVFLVLVVLRASGVAVNAEALERDGGEATTTAERGETVLRGAMGQELFGLGGVCVCVCA